MLTITKEFRFEAAHRLPFHDGKCKGLHGHSYRFFLEVRGDLFLEGPKTSMVFDYKDIGSIGKAIVEKLDHTYLNDVLGFEDTTAEKLSMWIFDRCKKDIPGLWSVVVKETESSSARCAPMESRILTMGLKVLRRVEENLMSKVIVGDEDDCWPFFGSRDEQGYGYCHYSPAGISKAHRLVMWLQGHEVKGRVVMHTCDNPPCCNPKHLKVGDQLENEWDKSAKGRRPMGGECGVAILTDRQVFAIWNDFQRGELSKRAFVKKWEERLGLKGRGLVSNVINGVSWNHITRLPPQAKKK